MDPIITFPMFGDQFQIDIPRFFEIFGFRVYYYALFIVLGFTLAGVYLIKHQKLWGLTTDNLLDLLLISVPCGIVGARLYYMVFNFKDFFGPGQWGNIFRVREGGLAVYGGIIASVLVAILYARKKKLSIGNILDAGAFGLFIGQSIGRWGNFINREAYGIETELPWKMGLTYGGITTYHHPTFLYESLWNFSGFLLVHFFSKKYKSKYPGQYFLFYVAWYGVGRFMIEGLRTDSLYIPGTDFRVSQWLAAGSLLVAISLFLNNRSGKFIPVEETGSSGGSVDSTITDDEVEYSEEELEDMTDLESIDELAKLDGASDDEIEDEVTDKEEEEEEE